MILTDEQARLLGEPIVVLGLDEKLNGQLEGAGVFTIGELLNCCSGVKACFLCDWLGKCHPGITKLSQIRWFGEGSLQIVYEALGKLGFSKSGEKDERIPREETD